MTVTSSRRSPPPRRSSATHSVCETRTARCARGGGGRFVLLVARARRPLRLPGRRPRTLPRGRLSKRRHCRRPRHARARRGPRGGAPPGPPRPSPRLPQRGISRAAQPLAHHGLQTQHGRRGLPPVQRRQARPRARVQRLRQRHRRAARPRRLRRRRRRARPLQRRRRIRRPVGAPQGGGAEAGEKINCRKCRRLLARGANALRTSPGRDSTRSAGEDARRRREPRASPRYRRRARTSSCSPWRGCAGWKTAAWRENCVARGATSRWDISTGAGVSAAAARGSPPRFTCRAGRWTSCPYESGGGGTTAGPGERRSSRGVFACRDSP